MQKPSDLSRAVVEDIMNTDRLPKSDLRRLGDEVTSQSPEAALPSNLSSYWLVMIARDLERLLGDDECVGTGDYGAAPVTLIAHILLGRTNGVLAKVSIDDLLRMLAELQIEINLEIVRQSEVVDVEPATLETIFTEARYRPLS